MTNDNMERVSTEDSRFYKRMMPSGDILYYPSVSTILRMVGVSSPFLDNWKEEQAEKLGVVGKRIQLFLDASRGTNVHAAIEEWNNGTDLHWKEGKFTDDEWARICRYMLWEEETKPTFVANELRVYSDAHGFAGTADGIILRDGKRYLIDFKTGKDVYDEYKLQGSAYAIAHDEMHDEEIDGVIILALAVKSKKGWKECVIEEEELAHYKEGWLKHLELFRWANAGFSPKLDLLPSQFTHEE